MGEWQRTGRPEGCLLSWFAAGLSWICMWDMQVETSGSCYAQNLTDWWRGRDWKERLKVMDVRGFEVSHSWNGKPKWSVGEDPASIQANTSSRGKWSKNQKGAAGRLEGEPSGQCLPRTWEGKGGCSQQGPVPEKDHWCSLSEGNRPGQAGELEWAPSLGSDWDLLKSHTLCMVRGDHGERSMGGSPQGKAIFSKGTASLEMWLLISMALWPRNSHMATPGCKGNWETTSLFWWWQAQLNSGILKHKEEGEDATLGITSSSAPKTSHRQTHLRAFRLVFSAGCPPAQV